MVTDLIDMEAADLRSGRVFIYPELIKKGTQ